MRKKLRDIAEIQLGYQPRTKLKPAPAGSHRVIQIKDVGEDDRVNYADLVRIAPERDPERYAVKAGDVLLIARGKRLRAVDVGTPPFPVMAISFFYIVRPDRDLLDPAYLVWIINQPPVQGQIERHAMGTGIPHIRRKPVENLEVNIPPMEIQQRIVRLDGVLAKEEDLTQRLLEKRREMTETICRRASEKESRDHCHPSPNGALST